MALRDKEKSIAYFSSFSEAYAKVWKERNALLRNFSLDFPSSHIQISSDDAIQDLPDEHSQVFFGFLLADGHNQRNLFHRHSSLAMRGSALTDKAELLALDIALLELCNQRKITCQLLQMKAPTVLYIDNRSFRQHFMYTMARSMPGLMHYCR